MKRRRLAFLAVAAVFVLLFGGRWVALRYTEHLWFDALGEGARWRLLFLRAVGWQAAVFAATFAWYAAHCLGVYASIGSVHLPRRLGNLEIDEAVPPRTLRAIALGIAALLALATAYTFADLNQYVSLARTVAPFGSTEPVLHRDASFYMGVLPLLELLHLLASVATMLAALLVAGLYGLTGSLTVSGRRVRITPHARSHLVVILCALAMVIAWGFYLDAAQLVAGGGHAGGGLSPSDRAFRIPAANALAVIGLVVAAGSVLALRWIRPPLLFVLWAVLGISVLLGRFVIPVMTEAWGASGNAALVHVTDQTTDGYSRLAFGLENVTARSIRAGEVRPESAAALGEALEGLYAWSADQALPLRLLEAQGADSAHNRVWAINAAEAREPSGRLAPAALAVSQTDVIAVQRQVPRPRWTEMHRGPLAWGGDPIALDARMRGGALRFLAALDPADSAPPGTFVRREPGRIRFLPAPAELAVVGPDESTVGEPAPGVLLSGMVRRVLLAWALQSPPLLDDHTSNADRVLYWRDIPTRLARLYPFAAFDVPHAALVNDRLTWIVDGYLPSSRFPLAETIRWRGESINFLAACYLVTVDAVSGQTRFYLRPAAGAFAASVARADAVDPLPPESMPAGVRGAMRYPSSLLAAQAAMLAQRVERDSRGPTWRMPWADTTAEARDVSLVPATSALLGLDGDAVHPWRLLPLIDARDERMAALVAGTVGDMGRLQLLLLRLAASDVPTPQAAALRIGAAPALAATAAGIQGAQARGSVLVIPAAGAVVFVQPLLSATHPGGAQHIEGVALLAGGKIGFGTDARSAARALVRGDAQGLLAAAGSADLAEARAAFLQLDSARLAGDWERFGRAWATLRRALRLEVGTGVRP